MANRIENRIDKFALALAAVGTLGYGAASFNNVVTAKNENTNAQQAFLSGDTNKGNALVAQASATTDQAMLDFGTSLIMGAAFTLTLSNVPRRKR